MRKAFLPSLSVDSLKSTQQIRRENMEALGSFPLLVLVTGKWSQGVCLDSYILYRGRLDKIPPERYDHLERLGAEAHSAESSEVTKAYRVLEYHCSICSYEEGPDRCWRLSGVSPMLSDIVVIPRILEERKVEGVMRMMKRALTKTLKDSLILAGGGRYKEDTFELKREVLLDPTPPLPEGK